MPFWRSSSQALELVFCSCPPEMMEGCARSTVPFLDLLLDSPSSASSDARAHFVLDHGSLVGIGSARFCVEPPILRLLPGVPEELLLLLLLLSATGALFLPAPKCEKISLCSART